MARPAAETRRWASASRYRGASSIGVGQRLGVETARAEAVGPRSPRAVSRAGQARRYTDSRLADAPGPIAGLGGGIAIAASFTVLTTVNYVFKRHRSREEIASETHRKLYSIERGATIATVPCRKAPKTVGATTAQRLGRACQQSPTPSAPSECPCNKQARCFGTRIPSFRPTPAAVVVCIAASRLRRTGRRCSRSVPTAFAYDIESARYPEGLPGRRGSARGEEARARRIRRG